MALLVSDLIEGALRKLGALASGRSPTAAESADCLEALQGLYREFVAQGVFGRLNDVLITDDTYSARENERIVCNSASGVIVTLPDTITSDLLNQSPIYCYDYDPSATDYGRGCLTDNLPRPPRDGSAIVICDILSNTELYYVYDGSKARWVALDSLGQSDTAPLSNRYGEGLKAILATRLAPEFNVNPSPIVVAQANTARWMLSAKSDRSTRPTPAEHF